MLFQCVEKVREKLEKCDIMTDLEEFIEYNRTGGQRPGILCFSLQTILHEMICFYHNLNMFTLFEIFWQNALLLNKLLLKTTSC